jgi:hypothetical protein
MKNGRVVLPRVQEPAAIGSDVDRWKKFQQLAITRVPVDHGGLL